MAKLPRKTQKIFCSNPTSENQTSVFGTMKTANKQYSSDIEILQSNAAYEQGWKSATIASYKPFMEDFNTLNYINTSQLAYLFQQGIPEWDESTTYYKNSFCSYNGDLWKSLIDDNLNNTPLEGESWTLFTSGKKSGSGLELCDIGMALYVDETKGLRRYLNGQIVDINTNTQAFLNRLLQIQTTNPELFTTETNWQSEAILNIDGCVYKFVLNYDSTGTNVVSVRLPKYPDYVEINANGTTKKIPVKTNQTAFGNNAGALAVPAKNTDVTYYVKSQDGSGNVFVNNEAGSSVRWYADITDSQLIKRTKLKLRYFIQIATGSETENNIVNDIELNNPYSLFDSKYSDHKLNNLSWLKSEGQWNAKAVYPTAYDELLREYNNPDRLSTFNKDAFTVVGSPTITDDGVASGFSADNYLTTQSIDLSKPWQLNFKYTIGANVTTSQGVFYFSNNCNLVQSSEGHLDFRCFGTNQSYWIKKVIYTNTTYYGNIGWDGSQYYFNLGTEKNNLIKVGSFVNSNPVETEPKVCQIGVYLNTYPYKGSIDLKPFSITVDGQRVLSGANSMVKLSTEEYTDYDFVLNTADETFRLPLKTKLASGKAVVGNGMTLGVTNGTLNASPLQAGDDYVYSQSYYGKSLPYNTGNTVPPASRLPLGSALGVTTDPTKSGMELSDSGLYLYFYVGETVQNANLIDAGRIGEQVANKVNISNTQWATNACSPDYTAGVDVGAYNSSSQQFTAPSAGIIYFFASIVSGGRPQIYINDVLFSDLAIGGTSTSLNTGIQIVLGKGDKYYATQSNLGYALGANKFYPLKGDK